MAVLCATACNQVPIVNAMLSVEFRLKSSTVGTMLRGNSVVSRTVVSVLRSGLDLTEVFDKWIEAHLIIADDLEAATIELIKTLQANADDLFSQTLKDVMHIVSELCVSIPELRDSRFKMMGGIFCLRLIGPMLINHKDSTKQPELVTPKVQKQLLAAAKALQQASNLQQTNNLTAATNILLQTLVDRASDPAERPLGQQTLDAGRSLALLQLLAVDRDVLEKLLYDHRLVEPDVVSNFDALMRLSDPFKPSLSRSVLSRSGSASVISRQREEKEFFAENALSAEFLADYFASAAEKTESAMTPIDSVLRVAVLASNQRFGVPQKGGIVVGRDLVDWLLETLALDNDRTKAFQMASDMLRNELVSPSQKEKRVQPFVDGDKFYVFHLDRIKQMESLFGAREEDSHETRCEQCGRQGARVESYCSICGHERGEQVQ